MNFNFDQLINRKGTDSEKWDNLEHKFKSSDVLPLWVADMDFQAPKEVIDGLKSSIDHGVFGYPMVTNSLQQAIVTWCQKRYDWNVQQEWIIFSHGVIPILAGAIRAFTKKGDGVIIQTPVYPPFSMLVKSNRRKLIQNHLLYKDGEYKIDFTLLEKQMKKENAKLMIFCSPHNPVGRVWKQAELQRLGELCEKYDVTVVSDEIHSDIILENNTHIPLAKISKSLASRTITCMAPSKTFNLAGLSAAYAVIENEQLRQALAKTLNKQGLYMVNSIGLKAMRLAYEHGQEWLTNLLKYIEGNITYAADFIKNNMAMLKVIPSEGTYLLWIDCTQLGLSNKELEEFFLIEAKVALNQGYTFGDGGEGFVRMNIACPRETLVQGLNQIKLALANKGYLS